jgi:hypothetical protein
MTLTVQVVRSIHELNQNEWDEFSAGSAFQSHLWYAFGEKVMGDRQPTYLIVREAGRIAACATLRRIHDEPLRLSRGLRGLYYFIFRRYPLLICRSPLASTTGLLLPQAGVREEAEALLMAAAREELKRLQMPKPGTSMEIKWPGFQSYLDHHTKRRRHYGKTLAGAEQLGLTVTKHRSVTDPHTARQLIEKVLIKHGTPFNPWMPSFLENLGMIDSTWIEVRQGDRLVGCAATLRDGGTQFGAALGFDDSIVHLYYLLMYETMRDAFEHGVKTLRLGSGAYDFKRNLGFELEYNNHVGVLNANPLSNWLIHLATQWS